MYAKKAPPASGSPRGLDSVLNRLNLVGSQKVEEGQAETGLEFNPFALGQVPVLEK